MKNPIHPGVILKQEIEKRSITIREFAKQANISTGMVSDICNQKSGYTAKTALSLQRVTNIRAEKWMQMLEMYLKVNPHKRHSAIVRHEQKMLNAFKKV